ncbi:hypothetical protein [Streptomyces sp. NPDC047981]|uniref:hypothetical protein n=1 Tax=Streptomyces sp. NPDC047981 TaxID=3154610 RepID=UPI0034412FFA
MTAIEGTGGAEASVPDAAGEATARFIRHSLSGGAGIDRQVLRSAAPFVVLLHRRSAILASAIAPPDQRATESALVAELVSQLGTAALEAEDIALAQLVSWARQAWSGRSYDVFDAERTLPAHLTHRLSELLRSAPSPVMLQATGTRLLRSLAEELRVCADEHVKIDRLLGPELFTRPVTSLLDGLAAGASRDEAFLEQTADERVNRALDAVGGSAVHYQSAAGAAKWRRLTAAADEVTERARRIAELAAEFRWRQFDVLDPDQLGHADLDPELVPVLLAALESDPAPGAPHTPGGESLLSWIAAEALASADPHHRHQIAVVARFTEVDPKSLEAALAPLERLRERGEELLRDAGEEGTRILGPLGEMVIDALARGDVEEAGQGVELLAEARAEFDVAHGLERMRAELSGLATPDADVALDVRTAETYFANGEVEAAAEYLRRAEDRFRATGITDDDAEERSDTTDAPPAGSPEGDPDRSAEPSPPDGAGVPNQHDGAIATIQEGWSPDASPDARAAARASLRQLAAEGSFQEVSRVARRLTFTVPDAAAELLEAAGPRFPRQTHPAMWQLQEQALRAAGRHMTADEVFHRGHPPLPPPDLLSALPVTPVAPLPPWLTPPDGAALANPAMAEAVRSAAANESADAARAFTTAARTGAKIALGPAVGWHVAAGSPAAALEVYRDLAPRQYMNAAVAWNVACAYAAVGADRLAVESLGVMARILPGRPNQAQKAAADAYCARLRVPSPLAEVEIRQVPSTPGIREQTRESVAKQMYESGDVQGAARELEDLLRENPSSPGAFLMLRICRETGDLLRAQAVVQRISEARGALSWRHHIELARTALDSRCADYDVARRELDRARELRATETWIGPLEQRLRELTTAGTTPDHQGAGLPGTGQPRPAWSGDRGASSTGSSRPAYGSTEPAAVVSALRSGTLPPPSETELGDLHDAVAASHDDYLVRDFAFWLMDSGRPMEAVRLLERTLVWTAPQRIPRVLLVRDRAAAAAGAPTSVLRPPSAPRLVDAGPPAPGRAHHLDVHRTQIIGPPATQPAIRAAQQPLPGASADDVADAWVWAARSHPVATGNALAELTGAGRAEEALRLHSELADTRWLGSGAAWNLGCAYAATGRLEAAAATFEYHARVSTRRYDDQQAVGLRALFAAVGRPVPTPATGGPEAILQPVVHSPAAMGQHPARPSGVWNPTRPAYAQTPTQTSASVRSSRALEEAESNAAQLIAQCRTEPTSHHFRLAADAARRAMRAGGSSTAGRYVATMRELFTYQPDPQPDTAASLAMVLEAAERYENAWDLLTEWIGRSDANAELLAPAVRVARLLGRVEQLHQLLLTHVTSDSGFELHLSIAKLAQTLNRKDELVHHAEEALRLNANCAEAASLLRTVAGGLPRRDHQQAVGLRQRLAAAQTTRRQAVEMLRHEYGDALAALRVQALSRFRPEVSRNTLKSLLGATWRERATDLLAAAEDDWELAADLARKLLDESPRTSSLIQAAADCLIEAERYDEVRTVAALPGSEAKSREILVRLACAQGDHAEVGRLMSGVEVWHNDRATLLAHVGVLAEPDMGASPAEAARLLLVHARLTPRSENLAGFAALLADRAGRTELVDEAIELLRREEMPPSQALVDSALAAHVPEALNSISRPLGADQLGAIIASMGADRERAVRFLSHPGRRGTGPAYVTEQRVRNRIRGRMYAEDGMVGRALEAYRKALELGEGQEAVLPDLTALCAEWGAPDPSGAAAGLLAGGTVGEVWDEADVTPDAAHLLAGLVERPGRPGPELAGAVEQVALAFAAGAAGPDALLCRRLGERWRRLVEMIEDVYARGDAPLPPISAAPMDVNVTIKEGREWALALASAALRDAALHVQQVLQQVWESAGHERLRADAGNQAPLSWRENRTTRLDGGPVELRLKLRAGSEPLASVTVRVRGTKVVHVLGRMEPESVASFFLAVPWPGDQLVIDAAGVLPDQSIGRAREFAVRVEPITRREGLSSRFRPGDPVNTRMFAGRAAEMDRLRAAFGDAWRESVPLVCMTGSRRAGKTSLVRQLTRLWGGTPETLLQPDQWRIPQVFPVLLDGQSVDPCSLPLLTWIAKEVRDRIEEHYDTDPGVLTLPEEPHAVEFRRWWRGVRRAVWQDRKVGLLLVVDESQEILRRYEDSAELSRKFGDLRRLRQDGTLALLLVGSDTAAQLGRRLDGTLSRQDLLHPLPLGPLDRQATLQVIHQGFSGTGVDVRPSAAELVFQYTAGHPQHVHMVGRALCELLESTNRAVVDDDLVDEAFDRMTRQDEAVLGLLDPYAPSEGASDVLFRIAQELDTDPDEKAVRAALVEEAHRCRLDDYLDYGLLVRNGTDLTWINSVVERWLGRQTAPWDDGKANVPEHEKELRPQYEVTFRYEDSPANACEVLRLPVRDVTYIAKQYPAASQQTLRRVEELFDGLSGVAVEGLPDGWKRNGSWLLHRKVAGRSLADFVRQGSAVLPFEAARMVMGACYTVRQVWESRKTSHGDIRPGNLIVAEGGEGARMYVVGWGHGGEYQDGRLEQLLPGTPSGYYPWAAHDGRTPTLEDDTFALAGVLYTMLSGTEQLPWDGPAPADGEAYSLRFHPTVPEPLQMLLHRALGTSVANRYRSPGQLAEALKSILPYGPSEKKAPESKVNLSNNISINTLANAEGLKMGDKFENSGTMINAALGKDIDNSNNSSSQGAPAVSATASLADLVTQLRAELDSIRPTLAPGDAEDLDGNVSSLAAEAASETPDARRVGRLAGWVRGILQGVGGAAAAITVVDAINGQFGA